MAGVTITRDGPLQIIKFDNISKKNPISQKAYVLIAKALRESAEDDTVSMTVLTGAGDYYSSGFDISGSLGVGINEDVIRGSVEQLRDFVAALIDYPKCLVAVVNGPAIGISVTTLGLCDLVWAVNTATFKTPFSKLGLCAEGCSSYTFPLIMGTGKANEMLLFGRELNAEEALQHGLVSELFTSLQFETIWQRLRALGEFPRGSMQATKKLLRQVHIDNLHTANRHETEELLKRFTSEEFFNGIATFLARKQRSKY